MVFTEGSEDKLLTTSIGKPISNAKAVVTKICAHMDFVLKMKQTFIENVFVMYLQSSK